MVDKDTHKVLRAAEKQGFEIRTSAKGYPMIYRDGVFITKTAQTPGDQRGLKNLIATLRRAGFKWPPPR